MKLLTQSKIYYILAMSLCKYYSILSKDDTEYARRIARIS